MELLAKDISQQRAHETHIDKIEEWLKDDLDVEKVRPDILSRLNLLNKMSGFIEDEIKSDQYARKIFSYYDEHRPESVFTEEEKRIVKLGLIFSDIGKSGPLNADLAQQDLIVRIFKIENVRDVKTPIEELIRANFPETAEADIECFKSLGLDEKMPVEKLWRSHSAWTKEIIENDGVPKEAIPAAALHHILEGDNADLMDDKGEYKDGFGGSNRSFDRPEKLIVILDKYDAFCSRLNLDHENAVRRVKEIIQKNQKFSSDKEFLELLAVLDLAFGKSE